MNAERTNTSRAKEKERGALIFRTVFFGLTLAVLAGVSGYFIFSVLSQHSDVALLASGSYTVRLAEVSEESEGDLLRQMETLKRLLDVEDMFISRVGRGNIALCAGRFNSRMSDDALSLLLRVREFEYGDERPFEGAEMLLISANSN